MAAPKALAHCGGCAEGTGPLRWLRRKALAQGAEGAPKQNFLKGAFGGAFGARPSASSWPLITHCPCKFPQPAAPPQGTWVSKMTTSEGTWFSRA